MTPNEYQNLSANSQCCSPEHHTNITKRFHYQSQTTTVDSSVDLCHAILGIGTESGELQDIYKKYLIYGKEIDFDNILEECGDLLWYIALALKASGYTMEEAMQSNVDKLKIRYPEKFTEKDALERKDKLNG